MNFFLLLLPLVCSGFLLPKNISSLNSTSLISSLADANPDDVLEVRRLVDDLIAAGETDRDTATTARNDAQEVKNAAESALKDAKALHTQTAGQLVDAQQEQERLTDLEGVKKTAKEDADKAKGAAGAALTTAQSHLDTETIRLDEEKASLERILELLDTLLPATGPFDWRLFTDSTVRRDVGSNNCWDVNEIAFFSDSLCSVPIEIPANNRIQSGYAGGNYKLGFAFDGSETGRLWGGRSTDGEKGSSEVWIGASDIASLECIKFTQAPSGSNNCRPSSEIQIQKRNKQGGDWITEKEIKWSAQLDGTHEFLI